MLSLIMVYGLINAICVAALVVLAQSAPLVDDDPLPASVLAAAVNDNLATMAPPAAETPAGPALPASPTVPATGRLRPMHAVA